MHQMHNCNALWVIYTFGVTVVVDSFSEVRSHQGHLSLSDKWNDIYDGGGDSTRACWTTNETQPSSSSSSSSSWRLSCSPLSTTTLQLKQQQWWAVRDVPLCLRHTETKQSRHLYKPPLISHQVSYQGIKQRVHTCVWIYSVCVSRGDLGTAPGFVLLWSLKCQTKTKLTFP